MNALILAAGFGTRLEKGLLEYLQNPANSSGQKELVKSWIEGKPKGLVPVKGKPIVEHLLEQLVKAGIKKENIYIHTNSLHYAQFELWAKKAGIPVDNPGNIINNKIDDNKNRRGPIGDLHYALKRIGYDKPLLVLAQDTLVFNAEGKLYDLSTIISRYRKTGNSCIVVYKGEKSRLSYHGIVEEVKGRVIGFEEKPRIPKSNLIGAFFHLYSPAVLHWFKGTFTNWEKYIDKNLLEFIDLGKFVFEAEKVHRRLDIGKLEDVLEANKEELQRYKP